MIVHVFNDQKKFSVGFFHFLKDYGFDLSETVVYHYGKPSGAFAQYGVHPRFLRSWFLPFGHGKLYRDMKKADKIIVHCLASPMLLLMLWLDRSLCQKVWWAVWGKDLYLYHVAKRKTAFLKLYELFRKSVIRNIGHMIGLPEDLQLAREWYGATGEIIPNYMAYPYSMHFDRSDLPLQHAEKLNVLLGNSASVTNEHKEAIQILKPSLDKLGKIYCPLSYGGPKRYAEEICRYGKENLGEHFFPLTEFLPLEEYAKIWDDVSIAVFNHNRQEAVTNTYSLILKKKTVYMRPGTTINSFLKSAGIVVYDFTEGCVMEALPNDVLNRNAEIIFGYISPDKASEYWHRVL